MQGSCTGSFIGGDIKMTERLDMGRQDVDCRNIDVDNTDGRFADRQASSDYDEEYRDGCEDEA